jgi:GNAT superfamily N-acetyltransferase
MTIIEKLLTGPDALESLDGVASLRIDIFREYPYLYDGKRDDEIHYLSRYAEKPGACVITASDSDTLVGAATGIPLKYEHRTMVEPVRATDYPADEMYYVGEVLFYPTYRKRGLGQRLLAMMEEHVRSLEGYRFLTCATVVRPDDHPLRPFDFVPIERFLARTGFTPLADITSNITWQETDGIDHCHPMRFWIKELNR